MISDKLNLTISTLNVNSLNVSTLGGKVSKTFVKIEGATGKKADILFLCDCRMGRKGKEIEKMFICLAMESINFITILIRKVGE